MLFFFFLSGLSFSVIYSAAEAFGENVLNAWYRKSRKKIDNKWSFLLQKRSLCDNCGAIIPWYGLIPILGYFLNSGKCRHCSRPIPLRYPVFEITAFTYGFLIAFTKAEPVFLLFSAFYFFIIVVIAKTDWEYLLIPLEAVLIFLGGAFLEFFLFHYPFQGAVAALFWTLLFALFHILKPGSMGRADIYYVFALGMATAFPGGVFLPTLAALLGLGYYFIRLKDYSNFTKIKAPFGVFLGLSFLILRLFPF